ncbi:bifunctional N-glycosylase/AP lyase [Martiniozyma asiatica (nom. inval.)]|nr:bifunctional N-glycosylase/AP lyase [Martiniozyma asiatica]
MSTSKHFLRSTVSKRSSSFKTELDTFDKEIKKRKIAHIKLETEIKTEIKDEPIVEFNNENANELKGESNLVKPPSNFWPMYDEIKKMRQLIDTPVDSTGCFMIPLHLVTLSNNYKNFGTLEPIDPIKNNPSRVRPNNANFRFQLFTTLLFSSQTKDETNFNVVQLLHLNFLPKFGGLTAKAIHSISYDELDKLITQIGFHRRKSEYLKLAAERILNEFNEDIPNSLEDLLTFKGIGYKMGILIMQGAWNKVEGISVDTHMARLCGMFNWVPNKSKSKNSNAKLDAEYVRKELQLMLSDRRDIWQEINPVLVGFGQTVCTPTGRRCDLCWLNDEKNNSNKIECPAVDKKLLLRVKRGTNGDRKIRGDLKRLLEYKKAV